MLRLYSQVVAHLKRARNRISKRWPRSTDGILVIVAIAATITVVSSLQSGQRWSLIAVIPIILAAAAATSRIGATIVAAFVLAICTLVLVDATLLEPWRTMAQFAIYGGVCGLVAGTVYGVSAMRR